MSKSYFDSVICFGGEDWWYHNRGHIDMQLMRRFARIATTVYINSIVMQKPKIGRGCNFFQKLLRKTNSILRGLQKSDAGFWVFSPLTLPVHHLHWAKPFNIKILEYQIHLLAIRLKLTNPLIWVACPPAYEVATSIKKNRLVYQRTDRYEEFPNVDKQVIVTFDAKLKATADLTIFVNKTLYDQEANKCKKAIYLDHGVDFELFASADKNPFQPEDIINVPRPLVGFYGGFSKHTIDVDFLEKVIGLLPEKSFVFVGQPSFECATLTTKKNVWMLGQKSYELIPHYGKCFDVAIMPFQQNQWIQVCNPIKLKEYLALGKPIVSTPFNELNKYLDVVYQAKKPEDFAQAIEKALSENNSQLITLRKNKVINDSWDSKARIVVKELFPDSSDDDVNAIYDHTK